MLKTLSSSDYPHSKCAEIHCGGERQQFSIACCYCNLKTSVYDQFQSHFRLKHSALIAAAAISENEQGNKAEVVDTACTHASTAEQLVQTVEENMTQVENQTSETDTQSANDDDDDEEEIPLATLKETLDSKVQKPANQSGHQPPIYSSSLQCPMCGVRKNNKYNLQSHINSHTGARPHRCERCGKHFTNSGNLWKHIELVHKGNRTQQCTHCEKRFQFRSQVKRHELRVHLKVRPHSCTACESAYFTPKELQEHMQQRHVTVAEEIGQKKNAILEELPPPSNYVCEHCGKSFVKYSSIWSHRRVVHSDTPDQRYVCAVCAKPLHTAYHLREHMNTHTGDRPHACAVCGKTFQQKKFLRDHARIHSGIKAFACHICGKKFTQAAGLYCHAKTHLRICN